MSDANAKAEERAVRYMTRLLQMNPFEQGDEIIAFRTTALGLAKKTSTDAASPDAAPREDRRKHVERLEKLRADFWTMPLDQLQPKLAKLKESEFPEVEVAARRLQVLAANRAEFPKLTGRRGFDPQFLFSLKRVLVSSPRDVSVLREQVLATFRTRAGRRKGRAMVKLIKKELPDVYALEAEWFDALYRQKAKPRELLVSNATGGTTYETSSSGNYWWMIGIAVIIALRLLRAFDQD